MSFLGFGGGEGGSQSSSSVCTPPGLDWKTKEGGLQADSVGSLIGKGKTYKKGKAKDAEGNLLLHNLQESFISFRTAVRGKLNLIR